MFPSLSSYKFIAGKGMVSDDTEHTCIVAQSLLASHLNEEEFGNEIQWRLKRWFWLLPAGVGFGTLRALLKLSIGYSRKTSGVFSAGNGPAMRSAVIGVCCTNDSKKLKELVRISTEITHKDPRAYFGALAVALGASMVARGETVTGKSFLEALKNMLSDRETNVSDTEKNVSEGKADLLAASELTEIIEKVISSIERDQGAEAFADSMGLQKGISGYIYHTVPLALHVWLRHQDDLTKALEEIIGLGGDTDTTAAIVGALVGTSIGQEAIPHNYLDNLSEWPANVKWMINLGNKLAVMIEDDLDQDNNDKKKSENLKRSDVPGLSIFHILLRNVFFIAVILLHVIRRMLPPY
jgi:ADP-ribosylglycohydrolase